MNFRKQVLEAELKAVRVIGLTHDHELAQAANEREIELLAELSRADEPTLDLQEAGR